jgi:quercetin dioxygenase-like cupin family protein
VFALCPPGPAEAPPEHDRKASPGGVTVLRTDHYDRIPDSGLVRGGMFFLDPGGVVPQISQDESTKIFVFLNGDCELTVGDETRRLGPGEGAVIPREVTHSLRSAGAEKLTIWVTVTPNTSPSHTRYEQLPEGRWRRITPRATY